MTGLSAALLAGLAVAVLVGPLAPDRLSAVLPRPASPAVSPRRSLGPTGACLVGGAGLAVLLGGTVGVLGGLAVVILGPRGVARLEGRTARADREQVEAELPGALDLLAACLLGGAPLPGAVRAVAGALPGPTGRRLSAVASSLAVGSPPEHAWTQLRDPGRGYRDPTLVEAVVRVMVGADQGGAPVAAQVARLADEARAAALVRGRRAAARAGVLAVGPLGLCFLPAFVLIGIVPVVAGLIGPALSGL